MIRSVVMVSIRVMAAVIVLSGLTAQSSRATEWSVGVMGGVNFADVSEGAEISNRTCFIGGGLVEVMFADKFGGRVEALYAQKGAEQKVNPEFGDQDTTLKLSYFEVPVLFVARLSRSETVGFNLFGGPVIGFNMSSDVEQEDGQAFDLSDETEGTEFGAVIGFEFEHVRSSVNFFGDFRYEIGATSIFEVGDVKNRGFQLLAGLKFPLGGE